MYYNIGDTAQRLKLLREMSDRTIADAAEGVGITESEYEDIENGLKDFSVTFLYKCAEFFKVDMIEILTGDNPKLQKYTVVKKGCGLDIERRQGFKYKHLAYMFRNKIFEPLLTCIPYDKAAEDKPLVLSSHAGQEFDYVLSGSMKFTVDGKTEILNEGDAVYYDSSNPHGMIAVGGTDCKILVVLTNARN
ncbi:MAG: XRE family transcriptional regulator [Oscillospiraceae bacterium]|jgi:mannose-6-phosphate isomerase-like protein (cupin superfamily)|nr:XRE family transcriptional regulator [Oscillospiraceae bacterium]